MNNDIFRNAYLAQLGLIKEEDMQPVVPGTEDAAEEAEVKQVTFLTSDPAVLDAFNKGFEEVVFFVKSVDEATGEETVEEVKIGADSFGELTVTDVVQDEEAIEECNEITEEDEIEVEDDEEVIEEDEDEADDEALDDEADDEDEVEDAEIEEAVSHRF